MNKIVYLIIGALITEIIHALISLYKKRWGYSETIEQCSYAPVHGNGVASVNEIIIRKKRGKVVDINCPYYKERNKIKYNSNVYLQCDWGDRNMKNKDPMISGGICPFADN